MLILLVVPSFALNAFLRGGSRSRIGEPIVYNATEGYPCSDEENLGLPEEYLVSPGNVTHNFTRIITCAPGFLATRGDYANTTCDNGTWTDFRWINMAIFKPVELNCQSEEQVRALRELLHYVNYTELKLNESKLLPYPWDDSTAAARKDTLIRSIAAAKQIENDTTMDIWKPPEDMREVQRWIIENRVESRGIPLTQYECEEFSNHTLYKLPTNGADTWSKAWPHMKCSKTSQRSSTGWDYMNNAPIIFYRDGCYCESSYASGCPNKYPVMNHFGFAAMDEKVVSSDPTSPRALCWYWMDAAHPEWGYLESDLGYSVEAPLDPNRTL